VNNGEIVQNEYIEILLENGVIGFSVFIVILGILMYRLRHQRWLWAIVLAFLIQWNFFSGYPNALHIYVIFMAMYIWIEKSTRLKNKSSPT
ncbi:MAG: hypothetical protein WCO19_04420, partial [Candidatus Saccharibacteria bacterium]